MKQAQTLSPRERDLNTPDQLLRSLGLSAVAHLVFILLIALASGLSAKKQPIVPSPYMVKLITPKEAKPRSLLEPSKPKPPPPVVKKTPELVKKEMKRKAAPKKKAVSKGKKIVPIKKKEYEPKKETAPEPKKEIIPEPVKEAPAPPPKKEIPPVKEPAPVKEQPAKTVITEGTYFPYVWYLKIVERKVDESWVTHGVDISGKRADPVVRFSIARDGSVFGLTMERSSGSQPLDQTAVEAVRGAAPFPPLPDDYKEEFLVLHFGFSYEQRQ